jgi:hypothetical protein
MTHGSCIAIGGCPSARRGPSSAAAASPQLVPSAAIGAIRSAVLRIVSVTSSGTSVIGRVLSNTTAAACGSAWMLNSAAGVTLPREPPPMMTSSAIPAAISGAMTRAVAMLVKGPSAHSVMLLGPAWRSVSTR